MARGVARHREVIDDARELGLVTVFLKGANFRDTERLLVPGAMSSSA